VKVWVYKGEVLPEKRYVEQPLRKPTALEGEGEAAAAVPAPEPVAAGPAKEVAASVDA